MPLGRLAVRILAQPDAYKRADSLTFLYLSCCLSLSHYYPVVYLCLTTITLSISLSYLIFILTHSFALITQPPFILYILSNENLKYINVPNMRYNKS